MIASGSREHKRAHGSDRTARCLTEFSAYRLIVGAGAASAVLWLSIIAAP